jgi:hypothetical protein
MEGNIMSSKDDKDAAEKFRLHQARQLIKTFAIDEMNAFIRKYGELDELAGVFAAMQTVIAATEKNRS